MLTGMTRTLLTTLLYSCIILSGCETEPDDTTTETGDPVETPLTQLRLSKADSCDAFTTTISNSWIENLIRYPYYGNPVFVSDLGTVTTDASLTTSETNPSSPTDVSQTNTQEFGVDELDRVKASSDGLLYIAVHDMLVIQQAFPPESMVEISHLALDTRVKGLYLDEENNTVIVIARDYGYSYYNLVTPEPATTSATMTAQPRSTIAPDYYNLQPSTEFIFIDVSDAANPLVTERIKVEGSHNGTRLIGNRIHLVSNYTMRTPDIFYNDAELADLLSQYSDLFYMIEPDQDSLNTLADQIRTRAGELIATLGISDYLPEVTYPLDTNDTRTQTLACDSIYKPAIALSETQLLTVTSVDTTAHNLQQTAALGSGWTMYASTNDIFVSQSSSGWWWNENQRSQTVIHRFGISENAPQYLSSGLVYGYPNDSFNFSYFSNHLRVATTEWNWNSVTGSTQTNHMYVLADDNAGNLDITGAVNNFAENESIYSVRFLDDRAFVVTYRVVDPLFAFDLSDPTSPVITGELEIPGFSTYMHPIDNDHLLTIGRDADFNMQLQVFDISDMSQPEQLYAYTPDFGTSYNWSPASWDHHAFTYYAPASLLAIPMSTYDWDTATSFEGIVAFNIDLSSGISELGRIDHSDIAEQVYCTTATTEPLYICDNNSWELSWLAQAKRSVVMTSETDTYLYSISNLGVKASNIDNMSTPVSTVTYPLPAEFPYYWYLY